MSETSPITEQANPETELARDEFKQLLALHSKPVEPDRLFECLPESLRPSSESTENHSSGKNHHHEHQNGTLETGGFKHLTLIPPRTLPLLHDLALQMVQAGNQQQLLRIYRDTRSSVMDASLRKLGVEKLSKEDVRKMQWEVLEAKIGKWVLNIRIAVEVLFVGERRVCDQIFEGFDTLRDQCFAECIASSVSMLLSFGDAIARSKRSPEKLFVLLDMYEIMRELLSEIEVVFGGKACNEIRESTFGLTKRLAQTAQETFDDFEEAVEKDAKKTAVLDGTVHPLTIYVINYVKFLFDYQSTLEQLFQEFESSGETSSQLATMTMRIMQALQTNLDGKSKQFRDPALMHLFLMNNIHYMVRFWRRSEAKYLLGDDWVQRYRRVVQQHANQYRRNAWSKILQCLSTQGLTSSSVGGGSAVSGEGGSGASRGLIRDRFKTFNIQFEELHQKQSQWIVHDSELREALRLAVAQVLLPAYRSFIKRFGPLVESGKNPQKYIRYTAADLERMLGEFFEGKTSNEPTFRNPNNVRRRRKRIVVDALKSVWTGAFSASAREHNNVDMAQQREPLLTGEFERGNDLIGGGIEIPRDTPDDQDELKKLEGSKSRDMVDDFESGWTGAVSASAREQNNVEMAQQQEPLLTGECEQAIDLTGGGIELPDDQDELKKLEGSKSRDMVDFLKSGWTLLLTSLIIEIASAVFDQLGYALVGMVLAFVALLVATADLIHLARKERMSLLPIFHRPSTRTLAPGKPVGTIVEYFGLVGAVWQCFYSTVEYAYARQKRDNPIKMSLLPFIFLSCVVISKLIKTEFIDESA